MGNASQQRIIEGRSRVQPEEACHCMLKYPLSGAISGSNRVTIIDGHRGSFAIHGTLRVPQISPVIDRGLNV